MAEYMHILQLTDTTTSDLCILGTDAILTFRIRFGLFLHDPDKMKYRIMVGLVVLLVSLIEQQQDP